MKKRNIIAILICTILASCGEDRREEYIEKTALNRSIENVMRLNYYWYEDIPESKSLNFFTKPHSTFFNSLLSKKDANNSYLEDPTETESLRSYGIKFDASFTFNNDTAYALRVLHVDSDSPAYEAGLERGDWIIKRNDRFIIKSRIDSLHKGNAVKLVLGKHEEILNENGITINHFTEKQIINLGAARITSDHPVHASGIFARSSSKIGYLAYNHFTPGETNNDETYNDALRTISKSFKEQDVNEVILDLRYNTGGDLKSAQLLGSILAPQEALGKTMCYLKYNTLQSSKDEEWFFSNDILGGGSNLNLKRLFVLTGPSTASTSDVLINVLRSHMDNKIILIGQPTKGNHTETHAYNDEAFFPYILHLVDCIISNADGDSPTTGFAASYPLNEVAYTTMKPLGNEKEVLLLSALSLIETGAMPVFNSKGEVAESQALPIRKTSIR